MAFSNNHEFLYFDTLRRTQKAETVNCLIHASYQAKFKTVSVEKRKEVIAKLLKFAYDLYGIKAESYIGDVDQFDSQYTIGHELGIWINSDLELNRLASKVATYQITVKEYFDIVFLNYIQPIDNRIVHPLYDVVKYLFNNNKMQISKEDLRQIYSWVSKPDKNNINGLFNMLIGTSYFKIIDQQTLLVQYLPGDILKCCNTKYMNQSVVYVKEQLKDTVDYVNYLIEDHRSIELIKIKNFVTQRIETINHTNVNNLLGYNKIYYGIPGCGKSWKIENEVLKDVDKKNDVFRTTFYLDYSNSDFIGQIYPKVINDNVTYEFVPGPFTMALERAFEEPNKMIYLVIEEINRGNAAAIFGDTFQLLDRLKKDHDGRVIGDSEYPITNSFITDYFTSVNKKREEDGKDLISFPDKQVYIPHNLTILATMNTSDQNVFPLDTAFKRRWNMEKVISNWEDCDIANLCVPFTDITWKNFAETINVRMIDANEQGDIIISEDKKMGAYFATADMLVEKNDRYNIQNKDKLIRFVTNVVDYLFNDVTKFSHDALFNNNLTFDAIYESAIEYELSEPCVDFFLSVFKDRIEPDVVDDLVNTNVEQEVNNEQTDSNN